MGELILYTPDERKLRRVEDENLAPNPSKAPNMTTVSPLAVERR
jgi:hypothetical protein